MANYITQLRRGTKEQWQEYEQNKPLESMPLAGELVIEFDNGVPRLKIGDGATPYSRLPYMSVDSFLLPTPATIHLSTDWIKDADNRYYQVVEVKNAVVTPNSKIDLQITPEDLTVFHEKDLAFVAENDDGVVRVYCVGQVPKNEYTLQATVKEVAAL